MVKFRKVVMTINKISNGMYKITANYKNKDIVAHTNDSECYDWLEDDSNNVKHTQAKRHAYNKIATVYDNKYN